MYQDHVPNKNILQYLSLGIFVVGVGWGTLLGIDWLDTQMTPPVTISDEAIPDFLQLRSEPQDVLFAEAYVNSRGEEELRYAYMTGEVPVVDGEAIDRRTPVSKTEVLATEQQGSETITTLKTTFFAAPQFYQDEGTWRQIEYATTTPDVFSQSGAIKYVKRREWWERLLPGKSVFAQTSTFYPDPDTETSSVDGVTIRSVGPVTGFGFSSVCNDARNNAASSVGDNNTAIDIYLAQGATDNSPVLDNLGEDEFDCNIARGFFLFNTASLPDGAVISSATLQLYVTSSYGIYDVALVSSNPSSNTGLVIGDHTTVGSTVFANYLNTSSVTPNAYNTFTLNSSGINNISLTGVTKKAVRIREELESNWSLIVSGTDSGGVTVSSAEVGGTGQDPRLEVTYVDRTFSFGQWFPF